VSRYQKGKTNLDFTEARDSEWQWHRLGHMQVCTSLQTNNPASQHSLQTNNPASQHSLFTGCMPFLSPNQQHQSTEGKVALTNISNYSHIDDSSKYTKLKSRESAALTT